MRTNCVNCGAAIDVDADKCPFCGTTYFDLTAIDFASSDPVALRMRIPFGQDKATISMLAILMWGIGVGIPLVIVLYMTGWLVGSNSNDNVCNWMSGWDTGWERGFDAGYMCGIEDRRKDKKSLKQKAEEEV